MDAPSISLPAALADLAVSPTGFVFDPASGQSFTVNDTGLAVLRGLRDGLAPDAIASRLATEFDAPEETIRSNLAGFVAQLHRYLK